MNESQLTEVFGSIGRFRVLRTLFAEPARGFGQRELASEAGIDAGSIARWLRRWVAAGLVTRREQDGLPRYQASKDPSLAPLVALMQQDSRLVRTLREALLPLKGVQAACVFGSVARGEAGADSDIDVLVLGSLSELKINVALKPAARALGRDVHATASTIASFQEQLRGGESFAQDIVRGPRIPLIGDVDAEVISGVGGGT
ncbi:MAG: nucleotidyltransferase domain-containing protein [Mitsuaria chitosanitabida]|jgi:predicted nucleotidyltransferase|uniref:nucleotidyltransferase domain-containing protein n=1 Tax=Roseateles chitosanitabidus TaxID=65048 RepID=UPI001B08056A|nr:nucleotidyltransferase domain-containing protein [Roseateles chitosanitabidus]MBO9687159.1 nucleotidyltransferase domain-containing protein [Roseateles chitosanitabidus]